MPTGPQRKQLREQKKRARQKKIRVYVDVPTPAPLVSRVELTAALDLLDHIARGMLLGLPWKTGR